MSWVDHVIWWQVYPLGFLGAEKELGPFQGEVNRLPRLQGWLDHLISWGGNGLLLGPIVTSSSHGYDTIDYFQIDPRLGDDADFDGQLWSLGYEPPVHSFRTRAARTRVGSRPDRKVWSARQGARRRDLACLSGSIAAGRAAARVGAT